MIQSLDVSEQTSHGAVSPSGARALPRVTYKTKIERVRGIDGAPRHQFLWDVTAIGGSKRIIGCGTVRTRAEAMQKSRETIEHAERRRLIRARLLEALRALPDCDRIDPSVAAST